jgi:hypothetical protein
MGWWENIEGYQLGDIVADMFTNITKKIKSKHADISLQDFLAALTKSSNASAHLIEDSDKLPIKEVIAKLDDDNKTTVHPSDKNLSDVVKLLNEGFASTSHIFEETFDRKPKLGEIYANLNFVLPGGKEYFSLKPDASILYFQAK